MFVMLHCTRMHVTNKWLQFHQIVNLWTMKTWNEIFIGVSLSAQSLNADKMPDGFADIPAISFNVIHVRDSLTVTSFSINATNHGQLDAKDNELKFFDEDKPVIAMQDDGKDTPRGEMGQLVTLTQQQKCHFQVLHTCSTAGRSFATLQMSWL